MKILYMHVSYPDYLAAFTLDGLVRVLGRENVICYPEVFYDKKDLAGVSDSLKICYRDLGKQKEYSIEELVELTNQQYFDHILISRPYWMDEEKLMLYLNRTKVNFVVIDDDSKILDSMYSQVKKILRNRIQAYFMKEKLFYDGRVYPLQFSIPAEEIQAKSVKKEYSYSFMARITDVSFDYRNSLVEVLKDLALEDSFIHWDTNPMPREDYLDVMKKSVISFSTMGERFDCPRFYEIPANYSLIVSNRLPIDCWKPFVDHRDAVYFDSLNDVPDMVFKILNDEEHYQLIARRGHEHLKKYHTTEKRAEYLLDILKKVQKTSLQE